MFIKMCRPLWAMACLLLAALLAGPGLARAADDPPGRVGRIAWIDGDARLARGDGGDTLDHARDSLRNWPVTSGDELSVGNNSRAEIGIGSTRLRLGENSQLLLRRVDDERIELELLGGSLAVLLGSDEVARELSIETDAARLLPLGAGLYRIDVPDAERGHTHLHAATAWRNGLRIEQPAGSYLLQPGQRAEIYVDGGFRLDTPEADGFARWAMNDDDLRLQQASRDAPVPDEMTGAHELDRHGDWTRSADYGWVWYPRTVVVGWAPYRHGRWSWVSPWGWTWIDDAPWGFAPFHYGRWVWWRDRWGWVPGDHTPRPVYAPALVVWNGQPGLSWSISIGTGVAWYPLAPREVYVPAYAFSPRHVRLLNQPHVHDGPLLRRVMERPDEVLRHTPYRYRQFSGAVSTGIGRDGRDGRFFRPAPWRGAVELPPRMRAPQAPPVVTRIQPPQPPRERWERDRRDRNERGDRIDRGDRFDRPDRQPAPPQPDMRHHGDIDRNRPPGANAPPAPPPNPSQRFVPGQVPIQPGQAARPQPGLAQPVAPQPGASFPGLRPRDGARPDGRPDADPDGRTDNRRDGRFGSRPELVPAAPPPVAAPAPTPARTQAPDQPRAQPPVQAVAPAAPIQQTPPPRGNFPGLDRGQREAGGGRPAAPPAPMVQAAPVMPAAPPPAMVAAPPPAVVVTPPPRPEQRIAVPRAEPPRPPEVRQEQRRDNPPQRTQGRPDGQPEPRQDGRRERWPPGREQ
ncbi:conserved hypothetical protein [Leptothrix cholodnii SP-6]|uniref:Prolin-rich transmembrane protein n=1 Tax=Leptothrix cholodnii (strain ATCC 51168 / LMG 8142 / SP-6) TaxID=395495 RepID=B1XY15_LEPCP|nr:DUF6600 domain-containing protein [Leptothrix cholodnii]ACB32784.1 conserved hypothetical protein [Leptothrix cholodnii SP-6]